jgi:hypothetical protein
MAVKVDLPILTAKEKYNSAINIANQRLQQQEEEKARRSAMISLPTPPAPSRAGSLTMPTRLGKTKVQNNAYFASGVAEKEQQRFLDIADTLKGKANAIGSDVSRAGRSRTEADPAIKQQQEQLYAEADKYVQMANEARLQSQAAKDQARLSAYDKLRTQEEFWTVAQAGERAFVQQSKTQAGVDKLAKQANPSDLAAVLGDTGNAYYTSKYEQVNAMTDHEKGIYYYLLAKEGQEAADEFLNLLAESLNARIGIKDAEMLKENGAGGFVAPLAGLESAFTGTAQLISGIAGKPLPTPAMQYTSQAIRQDLNGVGGALYDVAYTAGNMAPSIALSAGLGAAGLAPKVANAIGALALGTSASGNAYKDALNRGYTQEQAMTYGLFTGASEAGLQYLLGGIGKLSSGMFSGKIGSAVTKALEKLINNPQVVATISKYVSSMGSEFTEEYLQEVL